MSVFAALAALVLASVAFATDIERAKRIQERLLAPCCYSESLAQHRSETALELKREIDQLVKTGRSDSEIVAVFTSRYGQRILVEPEGQTGVVLTVIPILAIATGVLLTALVIRKLRRPATAAPVVPALDLPDDLEL